ncbi:DnaT-like ssDNA-binding domain-containing protein [Modicisalibacter luteus]|uniref:DnaT-like ssDNA-binding domain-containing protein n=1 Tax=Modicisalibacter luteus TaxID=453962 RepID=A0ABV7M2X4_9GAMM|nr:DnaT-like ssDNA-binding domain-containing protein [Halomonas lutea]GHA85238.1 hypothetical protein GCM10007159_02900 [Halomonas lutea]
MITAQMLPALLGRPVAYQPVFARLPGVTVTAAIFLSQALFLTNTPTAQRRGGWFYKDQTGPEDSWQAETGMTAKQQLNARKQLVGLGVLEEQRRGMPAKTWYRVNLEELALQLIAVLSPENGDAQPAGPELDQTRPKGETRNAQAENQETPKGSVQIVPNGDFSTETTTENLSLNAGASIFDRAAQQDDDGQPLAAGAHQFAMTLDWQPDPEYFAVACQRAGLPADTVLAPHQLAKFTAHHADQGRRYGAMAWTAKLVDWIRNDLRHEAQKPAPNAGGANHASRHSNAGQRQRYSNLSPTEARRLAQQQGSGQPGGTSAGHVYDGECEAGYPGHG